MNQKDQAAGEVGPDFVPRPLPEVVTVAVDGDAIVYDERREMAHLLSPTGAIVWELLDGETPLSELAADLSEVFGTDEDEVLLDLVALVRELGHRGLLENPAGGA